LGAREKKGRFFYQLSASISGVRRDLPSAGRYDGLLQHRNLFTLSWIQCPISTSVLATGEKAGKNSDTEINNAGRY
jgi:hypothetical protein